MGRLPLQVAISLYQSAGTARAVLEQRHDIRAILPTATAAAADYMAGDISYHLARAEEEQRWCEDNGVRIVTIDSDDYPCRMRHCADAPLALFVRGNGDLNAPHALNMVGTRKSTPYGKDVVDKMVGDLQSLCPDLLLISGLAYGTDINAHRAALRCGMPTVGVVAHGQDTIYPQLHRKEAEQMAEEGGAVVTEYFHGTRPEARNFLQRNRIIAAMSDATIVIESASHGGGLVTARLAQDYGRDVFAIPGPIHAEYSQGCNNLIRDNKAALITSAADIVNAMMWQDAAKAAKARRQGIERTLFPELSPEEELIVNALKEHGDSQTNLLAAYTALPIGTIVAAMFKLEMKGVVTSLAGNQYHLIS